MTCIFKVLSASNLPHSKDNSPPSPYVEVYLHGPKTFFLGKTETLSNVDYAEWDQSFPFAFFRGNMIELVVKSHNFILRDDEICRITVDLNDIKSGEEINVEVPTNGAYFTLPVIAFMFERIVCPIQEMKIKSPKAYYIYATFEPPMDLENKPTEIPLEIKCVSMFPNADKCCFFDSNSDWRYLGGSSTQNLIKSRDGWTQVIRISLSHVNGERIHFIIDSHTYTGQVTIHVVGVKREEENFIYSEYLTPYDHHITEMRASTYNIHDGIRKTTDFYIDEKFNIINCEVTTQGNEAILDFEDRVIDSVAIKHNVITRRFLPSNEKVLIPNNKFTIIGGSTIYGKNGADIGLSISLYKRNGTPLKSWNNRFKGFISTSYSYNPFKMNRNKDFPMYTLNMDKLPEDTEFITVCGYSQMIMFYYYYEQKYVRITNPQFDQEYMFFPLAAPKTGSKACAICSIIKMDDGWYIVPQMKFFNKTKEAVEHSKYAEMTRRNYY